jgi:uncharacterized RDD family membrane protein YckC
MASMPVRPRGAMPRYSGEGEWSYAGFWSRFSAWFLDTAIFVGPAVAALKWPLLWLLVLPLAILYEPILTGSRLQATVGKRVTGLTVITTKGGRISFRRAFVRRLAKFLSGILGIGYLMIAFTERDRALHDMIAGTLVIWR